MPSYVIHIRLSDWAIVGAKDIVESTGKETINLPHATITRQALELLVLNAQEQGIIPKRSQEQVTEILGIVDENPKGRILMDFRGLRDIGIDEEQEEGEEENLSEIAQAVEENIRASAKPDIYEELQMQEVTIEKENEPTYIDLTKCKTFIELKKQAPLDILVKEVEESKDKIMEASVRCVYSGLSPTLWGTEKAREHVQNAYENFVSGRWKVL